MPQIPIHTLLYTAPYDLSTATDLASASLLLEAKFCTFDFLSIESFFRKALGSTSLKKTQFDTMKNTELPEIRRTLVLILNIP